MTTTPDIATVVVCVRDPDASNDYTVHGPADVRIVDVDLGYADLDDRDEFLDWAGSQLGVAADLDKGWLDAGQPLPHPAAEQVRELVETVRGDRHGDEFDDLDAVQAAAVAEGLLPHRPEEDVSAPLGWLLGQTYGLTDPPEGFETIQRDDEAGMFDGDLEAAAALAASGSEPVFILAIGSADGDDGLPRLAPQSDVMVGIGQTAPPPRLAGLLRHRTFVDGDTEVGVHWLNATDAIRLELWQPGDDDEGIAAGAYDTKATQSEDDDRYDTDGVALPWGRCDSCGRALDESSADDNGIDLVCGKPVALDHEGNPA